MQSVSDCKTWWDRQRLFAGRPWQKVAVVAGRSFARNLAGQQMDLGTHRPFYSVARCYCCTWYHSTCGSYHTRWKSVLLHGLSWTDPHRSWSSIRIASHDRALQFVKCKENTYNTLSSSSKWNCGKEQSPARGFSKDSFVKKRTTGMGQIIATAHEHTELPLVPVLVKLLMYWCSVGRLNCRTNYWNTRPPTTVPSHMNVWLI